MLQKRLSKDAVKVWLISELLASVIVLVILAGLFYMDDRFQWREWAGWILMALTVFALIGVIWSCISPFLQYKSWRYEIDEEFVRLKHGVIIEETRMIPMTKIQSVASRQGPVLRKYGLCSIVIETFVSSYTIPALPEKTALELRNLIAEFAKIEDVKV